MGRPVPTVEESAAASSGPVNASRRPRGNTALVLRYAAFAAIATAFNLVTQVVVYELWPWSHRLLAALVAGTIAGLVPKYILDKIWIFDDRATGARENLRKFTIYTGLSVLTTFLFWAVEYLFWLADPAGRLHYLGGVVGLALGYWAKYHLDRRFTFAPAPSPAPSGTSRPIA
jgi:putative flippase GtrA